MTATLISPSQLDAALNDARLRVIDATVLKADGDLWSILSGKDSFETAHIPGATFADMLAEFSDPTKETDPDGPLRAFALPTPEQFMEAARRHGVNANTTVVCYDQGPGMWATRLWWLFKVFGHADVAVLNGGLPAWQAEGLPIETGPMARPKPGSFTPGAPYIPVATTNDVMNIVDDLDTETILVNVLDEQTFRGEADTALPRKGRIPNSINVPFATLFDATGQFKDDDTLKTLFADAGIDGTRPVVTYCGGGVGATLHAFTLNRLGIEALVYDGSLFEWTKDDERPLETG
jgi:thiosulfate/3-mercaptopyruvate sulfurtransferase